MTGREPALNTQNTGAEPMLGGARRARIDRDLFWDLLNIDRVVRGDAIEKVMDRGAGRFYAASLVEVLRPGSRYRRLGSIWRSMYTRYHKLAAMDSLVRLTHHEALDGLLVALADEDLQVRQVAIHCIGRLEGLRAERQLYGHLADDSRVIRHAALQALADRWDLPAVRRLSSPIGMLAAEAARWLGEMEGVRVLQPLLSALKDRRPGGVNHELAGLAILDAVEQLALRFPQEALSTTIPAVFELIHTGDLSGRMTVRAFEQMAIFGEQFPAEAGPLIVRQLQTLLNEAHLPPGMVVQAVGVLQCINLEEARAAVIVYQNHYNLDG